MANDFKLAKDVSITDLFEKFIEASTMRNVLAIHHRILEYADLEPCEFNEFFPKLKRAVLTNRQSKKWKAKALFSKIDKRAAQRCYANTKAPTPVGNRASDNHVVTDDSLSSSQSNRNTTYNNNALQSYNCLIIGSGPAGLRTAIELQLLGAKKVVIVEKRGRFSRNNVLHLWPFVIDDLKSLGAKKFYGKFCAGSIDHISIRQLQLILLKVCLMIGCDFRDSCSYISLCPSSIKQFTTSPSDHGNTSDVYAANDGSRDNYENSITTKCDLHENNCLDDNSNIVASTKSRTSQEASLTDLRTACQTPPGSYDQKEGVSNSNDKQNEAESYKHKRQDLGSDLHNKERSDTNLRGAKAHFECESKINERDLQSYQWDIVIGADGRRNTLSKFFPRKEFRGRLAIAITANFINRQTTAETSVPEISGLSFIYNQDMFNALAYDTNIQLENICYYKDDTHYFVMTAKKKSLLERGVLINDYAATQDLLSSNNVDREALLKYAKDAAFWTTGLEPLDFALNHYGQEDCAMFDFTSMYAASNACKALRTHGGGLTLVGLVGDSLLEPFWPTGSGCARGFLSSFDAAWMCRQWAVNRCAVLDCHGHKTATSSRASRNRSSTASDHEKTMIEPTTYNRMALSVMAERESIYRILAQTKSENLQQNYSHWTLNPHTRYPNLNRHSVLPSQVEHLITDYEFLKQNNSEGPVVTPDQGRRLISPNSTVNSRRSPKKLKSANSSPLAKPRNNRNWSVSTSKQMFKSRSRPDLGLDDTYIEFEESYRNLVDNQSKSGTLPSSNNLLSLEAKRARDIDECLRQRRQKTKINVVREQLIGQIKGGQNGNTSPLLNCGNVALFNELKRLREQRSRGGSTRPDSKPRELDSAAGPMLLLNSMRRCASFAERIKSFESRLSTAEQSAEQSTVTTPKTPIDNVRNLPQFATLQELLINKSTNTTSDVPKPKIPVSKLTKEDWNVECWEKRIGAKVKDGSSGNRWALNKALSVDTYSRTKPQKQVEVFQDRIKEMAEKLKSTKKDGERQHQSSAKNLGNDKENGEPADNGARSVRSQGWINHLKRELSKGNESRTFNQGQPMNPVTPNKPIKKLFEDEGDEDDGIDVNKHYDHLCINRPKNKYLSKGAYTSHLTRTRYNSTTSKVINHPKPTAESKQAYLSAIASRASSASSSRSDYSTNTANSSSGSGASILAKQDSLNDVECFRCRKFVSSSDRIIVGSSTLHRICLTCNSCGITLRSNEVLHYLNSLKNSNTQDPKNCFMCAICKPSIRVDLNCEADKLASKLSQDTDEHRSDENENENGIDAAQRRLQSREAFLNAKVDYNELYKNIISSDADKTNITKTSQVGQSNLDINSKDDSKSVPIASTNNTTTGLSRVENARANFRIARSETSDDGSEQVTLILPGASTPLGTTPDGSRARDNSTKPELIDEEELQRILHLDSSTSNSNRRDSSTSNDGSSSSDDAQKDEDDEDYDDDDDDDDDGNGTTNVRDAKQGLATEDLSDDSSSLNSPPSDYDEEDNDDDGDDDDLADQNSTYDDLVTSEEFDTTSDREEGDEEPRCLVSKQPGEGSSREVDELAS